MPTPRRTTALLLVLPLLLTGCAAWRHGGTPTGIGGVTGRVVDANHVGVRGATVTVVDPARDPHEVGSTTTNPDGTFTVNKVPAARGLSVVAIRPTSRVGVRGRKDNVAVDGNRVTDIGELPLGVQR